MLKIDNIFNNLQIRHNEKGWKCQFCPELHETRIILQQHLESVHRMNLEDIEQLGILKSANMFVVSKKVRSVESVAGDSSSDESESDDVEDDDDTFEEEDEEVCFVRQLDEPIVLKLD